MYNHLRALLRLEVGNQIPHHGDDLGWVAVHHVAPECGQRTRKDLPLVREEADDIILVDKRDIHGQELEDRCQLLHRELTGRELELPPHLRLCKTRCLLIEPRLRLCPRGNRNAERDAHVRQVMIAAIPFHLREIAQAEREENLLLLEDHFADALRECTDPCLIHGQRLFIRLERLDNHGELALHLIVDAPHDLRGSRDTVIVENRHQ